MWEQKSRRHLPSGTAFRKEPSVSARLEQGQRTLGYVVWQGWACGPEWAAARDHLPLQSSGERSLPAQLALPPTQGLAILCPTLVKHHFVSASPFAFPVLLRAVVGGHIPLWLRRETGGQCPGSPLTFPTRPPQMLLLSLSCPVSEHSTLDPKLGCLPAFFFFFQSDKIWMRALFKAFILILL